MTVIVPVFYADADEAPSAFVAARGHHAEGVRSRRRRHEGGVVAAGEPADVDAGDPVAEPAGTDTPDDVAAILTWFREDPDRVVAVVVGIGAGAYPAFFIYSLRPATQTKG